MTAMTRDGLMRLLATILRPCQKTSPNDRLPNIPAAQAFTHDTPSKSHD